MSNKPKKEAKASKKSAATLPKTSVEFNFQKMETFYYPPTNSTYTAWLANFYDFCEANAEKIGITPEQLTKLKSILDALVYLEGRNKAYAEARSEFVYARDTIIYGDSSNPSLLDVPMPSQVQPVDSPPRSVLANSGEFIFSIVNIVRKDVKLTQDQKKNAGVLSKPAKKGIDPVLQVTVVNGKAVLNCPLRGNKGFEVWVDSTGTGDFILTGNSNAREYTDNIPLPDNQKSQQRTYKVRYLLKGNTPTGNFSNAVTVAVFKVV